MSTPTPERTVKLPKKFGMLNAISINMSNMVGTGPFITVPAILATMGGPQSLVCWFIGAIIAIADGLVFAELGTTFPSSGGSYNYLRECFGRERLGRLMAWLFVWQFLFSGTLEIATSNVGMALYCGFLFKGLIAHPWAMRALAASFSVVAMILLYRKIRDIARIMLVLWGALLVTSLWVVVVGFIHLQPKLLFDFPPGAFHMNIAFLLGLGNGTMLVMFNYLGYYNICHLGDEVEAPERVIPRAILWSIVIVMFMDLAISVAFTGALPWREMIQPGTVIYDAVGSVFMQRMAGFWASQWLTIMVLLTAFASTYSLVLGLFAHSLRRGIRWHVFPLLRQDSPHQRLPSPVFVAGRSAVGHCEPVFPRSDHYWIASCPNSGHVCRADYRPAVAAQAPPGSASPLSHVALSVAGFVFDGIVALHLFCAGF